MHAGLAHCPFVCPHRRPVVLAVGLSPATPWPLCGAPSCTDWSARSHWRDVPPYCIDRERENSEALNYTFIGLFHHCHSFHVLFLSCPNIPSHPRLPVLEARLCSVPFCRSWLFMMASCLCFRSISLALTSSSIHTSAKVAAKRFRHRKVWKQRCHKKAIIEWHLRTGSG